MLTPHEKVPSLAFITNIIRLSNPHTLPESSSDSNLRIDLWKLAFCQWILTLLGLGPSSLKQMELKFKFYFLVILGGILEKMKFRLAQPQITKCPKLQNFQKVAYASKKGAATAAVAAVLKYPSKGYSATMYVGM